jgi:hypothetical protein
MRALQKGYRGGLDALLTWQERELQHDMRAWAAINVNAARFALYVAQCAFWDALARHANVAELAGHQAKIVDLAARLRDVEVAAATQGAIARRDRRERALRTV